MPSTDEILATLPRSDGEIRMIARTYKGAEYVDLRFYWRKGDGEDPIPTKKGVTLRREEISSMLDALRSLAGNAEKGVD
jgi:hypothetical protein